MSTALVLLLFAPVVYWIAIWIVAMVLRLFVWWILPSSSPK